MPLVQLSRAEDHAEIAARLCGHPGWEQTLAAVVEVARETLRGDHVGLLLRHGGRRLDRAAVSDERAGAVLGVVLEQREGPELNAIRASRATYVTDTALAERWPRWAAPAERLGVRSAYSIALQERGRTFGSLTLYAAAPSAFDEESQARIRAVGTHAAIAISHAQQERTLRHAVDARHRVGLAQGVLMERHGIDADRAFAVLLRYSQDHNIKLRVVAEEILRRRSDVALLPRAGLALPA